MAHIERRTHTAKNGRKSLYWRARYEDPSGKLVSKTFERKIDAERFLVAIEADVMRGEYVDPRLGTVTLADWSDQWMRTTVHLKPKTRVGYESLLRKWVLPSFGGVKLANLQPVHVRQWISDMTGQGLSPSRVRQSYRLLSAMLGSAVESGYLAKTPCIGVKLPRLPKTDIVILRPEQVDVLARSVADSYRVLIYLLGYGGLRWGEAAALRRGRCDLLRSRIEVAESLAEVNGVHHFGTTKTHERRHVRLPAFLVEMLAQHLADLPSDPDALVFTAARGGRSGTRTSAATYGTQRSIGRGCLKGSLLIGSGTPAPPSSSPEGPTRWPSNDTSDTRT